MGYARMKRTSVPPTVWLALAVLYSASLVAASHFTNPPYPDTVKGNVQQALWDANFHVDEKHDYPYPRVAVEYIVKAIQEGRIDVKTRFDVLVYGHDFPVYFDPHIKASFRYVAGLEEGGVIGKYDSQPYTAHIFIEGSFDFCEEKHDGWQNWYFTRSGTCTGYENMEGEGPPLQCGGEKPLCHIDWGELTPSPPPPPTLQVPDG